MTEHSAKRPLRADAARNRARVLDAAEYVLARDGSAASMREIARQAGVGLGTIYRQFPTKESLFEEIIAERLKRFLEYARAALTHDDPSAAFFDFFAFAVQESAGEKTLVDALTEAHRDPRIGFASQVRELENTTEALLRRAQKEGSVRGDVALAEVLALILAMCAASDQQNWGEELRGQTLNVIFDGLRSSTADH
ncbi:TetR/AcrR family transcriptional regulator [Corynebacterium lowii]|uniref:HTH-type transcriptional repressor KstR n=1 Tax=Corynebacterium lowii TaxID=1544413 RepID=A0A0Q0UAP0_9CORY|nr:TetR/AcrR family transcriptional regulator [Corynebacterium lowii]KQB84864.1 HTH-type transcriptional repressor KstR [Corynebacterium lowii]MDP9851768.1 AcrR family transcriptional regulator [Corynebacterium lowii]